MRVLLPTYGNLEMSSTAASVIGYLAGLGFIQDSYEKSKCLERMI